MRSGDLELGVVFDKIEPQIRLKAGLFVTVAHKPQPKELDFELTVHAGPLTAGVEA